MPAARTSASFRTSGKRIAELLLQHSIVIEYALIHDPSTAGLVGRGNQLRLGKRDFETTDILALASLVNPRCSNLQLRYRGLGSAAEATRETCSLSAVKVCVVGITIWDDSELLLIAQIL